MPLVEIIRGSQTSDRAIAVIAALASKMGKFPIVVQDVPGFLVNRILSPYLNEAAWMIADGFKISDIDKAALNFGMPMGPVRLLDEVGLDVASHVSDIMFKGYGERMKGPSFASTLVSAGRKGKKSNAGFYDFVSSADKKTEEVPHPNIRTLLKIERPERVAPDLSSLSERLVLTLVNEAVRCLDEGVAGAPGKEAAGQIDLGTVMGMGFPPFRGGLMHYADSLGVKTVLEKLRALAKEHGVRFAPADGIRIRAEKGKSFLDAI